METRSTRYVLPAVLVVLLAAGAAGAQKRDHAPVPDLGTMVEFPAAGFRMGQEVETPGPYGDDWYIDQQPAHNVTLSRFYMDVNEVTVAEFALFLTYAAGEYHFHPDQPIERVLGGYLPIAGREDEPITYVTWEAAHHYCLWAGKRLPTEAEWEKAAAGSGPREYPWGDDSPTCMLASHFTNSSYCEDGPVAVGSRPDGATPEGLMDMAGNVAEWVADWYDLYGPDDVTDPLGPDTGTHRVVRGGGHLEERQMLRTHARRGALPTTRSSNIGFRCAWSADPTDYALRGPLEAPADEERTPTDRPLADPAAVPEVVASGLVTPTAIVGLGASWYVLDRTLLGVYEIAAAGEDPVLLVDGFTNPVDMKTDGTDLLVSDQDAEEVIRVGTDGSSGAIATAQTGVNRLAAAGGEVFWGSDAGIMRHTESGGVELLASVVGITDLALSDTHLYYTSNGGATTSDAVFGRVPRAGGATEDLMTSFGTTYYPTTVVYDPAGATAYFLYRMRSWPSSTYVNEFPESASAASTITYSPTGPTRASYAGGYLYWATSYTLVRMDPASDDTYEVVGPWTRSQGVLAGDTDVVWTDQQDGRVYRVAF